MVRFIALPFTKHLCQNWKIGLWFFPNLFWLDTCFLIKTVSSSINLFKNNDTYYSLPWIVRQGLGNIFWHNTRGLQLKALLIASIHWLSYIIDLTWRGASVPPHLIIVLIHEPGVKNPGIKNPGVKNSRVKDPRSKVPKQRSRIKGPGLKVPDQRSWIKGQRFGIKGPRSKVPYQRSRVKDSVSKIPAWIIPW